MTVSLRSMLRLLPAAALLAIAAAPLTFAQTPAPSARPSGGDPPPPVPPATVSRDEAGHATVRAHRLGEPIRLDGALDEAVYKDVPPIGDFIQQVPREGSAATERTEAWVMFDDEHLY